MHDRPMLYLSNKLVSFMITIQLFKDTCFANSKPFQPQYIALVQIIQTTEHFTGMRPLFDVTKVIEHLIRLTNLVIQRVLWFYII